MDYGEKIKEIKFGKLSMWGLLKQELPVLFLIIYTYYDWTYFQSYSPSFERLILSFFVTTTVIALSIYYYTHIRKNPILSIYKNGIFCYWPLENKSFIPWDNIKDIRFTKNKHIEIEVKHIKIYTEKMSWIKKEYLGYGFLGSNPSTVFKRNIKDFDIDLKNFEETIKALWKP